MDTVILVGLLSKFLQCYEQGEFYDLNETLSDGCVWESDWWSEVRESAENVIKYYQRKGAILQKSGCFPNGYLVELYGSEDSIEGKALYLYQGCDNDFYDLVLRLNLDDDKKVSAIKLQMKELYRMRRFYAGVPQY